MTVIDETLVGAAGCHEVGHRLGSLEIVGFDHLWRESEQVSVGGDRPSCRRSKVKAHLPA